MSKPHPYALLSEKMTKIVKSKKNFYNNFSTKKSYPSIASQDPKKKKEKSKSEKAPEETKDFNVPDRSYGDYYCCICDSHMNSEGMWEDHIIGKRHAKNLKKGNPDLKYDELKVESDIKYELRNVKDPVIGLSYIHEIRRKEAGFPPYYNCFLCHSNLSSIPLVIEHIISLKHRLNYIKENEPTEHELLAATNLRKDHLEPLVQETALKLEQKYGRGDIIVKQEKAKITEKRSCYSEDDDDGGDSDNYHRKPVKKLKGDATEPPSSWKPINSAKVFDDKKEKFNKAYPEVEHFKKYPKKSFPRDKRDISPTHYSHSYRPHKKEFELYDSPRHSHYPEDFNREKKLSVKRSRSQEQVKKKHNPTQNQPEEYGLQLSPGPSEVNVLPHEIVKSNESKNSTDAASLQDFIQKVFELPNEIFLKIFLHKLDNMELKLREEMVFLSKIIIQSQTLLMKSLPPEVQEIMKQKSQNFASSGASDSISKPPNSESNQIVKTQSDISFLKDFLNSAKNAKSSNQTATEQYNATNSSSIPTSQYVPAQQYQSAVQNTHVNNVYQYGHSSNVSNYQQVNSLQNQQSNSYPSMVSQGATLDNYSYTSSQQSNSGIPGLTLSSSENHVSQLYNNLHGFTSPSKSYETKNQFYGY